MRNIKIEDIENTISEYKETEGGIYIKYLKPEFEDILTNSLAKGIISTLDYSLQYGAILKHIDFEIYNLDMSDYIEGDYLNIKVSFNDNRFKLEADRPLLWEWVESLPSQVLNYIKEAEDQLNTILDNITSRTYDKVMEVISPLIPTFSDWKKIEIDKEGNIMLYLDDGKIKILS